MPVEIGAKIESDFTDPVGMLGDCHRRIERFLLVLQTVAQGTDAGTLSAEQRAALEASLRYFREGAPRHTQDEEASLFPRLRQLRDEKVAVALSTMERLEADHSTADVWHQEIDRLGARWLRDGALDAPSVERFRALTGKLEQLYAEHIQVEDGELFPLAAATLPAVEIRAIGREMAERRSIKIPSSLADTAS